MKVRAFSARSHAVSLLFAQLTQLTRSIGLNDVCDASGLRSGPLSGIRGAAAPTRNNLSHANKVRSSEMAGKLFWAVFKHLGNLSPGFVSGRAGKRFARKFKRAIRLVDLATIPLIASCIAELHRCRCRIEVFFKQIKQTLQLADCQPGEGNRNPKLGTRFTRRCGQVRFVPPSRGRDWFSPARSRRASVRSVRGRRRLAS